MRTDRLLCLLLFLSTPFPAGQGAVFIAQRSTPVMVMAQAAGRNAASGLTSSASSLTFGNEQLNSASAPQVITITNAGRSTLRLREVASTVPDFGLVHNCALAPNRMPAGSSCDISVRFVPGAAGLRNGNIKIVIDEDRQIQPLTIHLQGNGLQSPVTLSQTYLVFRTVLVGMTSMPQYVRLTNHGTAPATITSIAVSPDFELASTAGQCKEGSTLAPLGSCTIAVVWAPTDSGSHSGQIKIVGSDSGSPHVVHLQAMATGVRLSSGTLRWNPTAVGVTADSQGVELRNEGRTSIQVSSIEANGDFYQQNDCGQELIQHQSCSVRVWFQPTSAGERAGTVLVRDSDATLMQQVFLTGIGSPLDLSPARMDFGDQAVESTNGPQIVTITNRGIANVNIVAVNASGDFVIPGKTCGDTIAAGKSCRVNICFSPTATGIRTGALSVETGAGGVPQKVVLSGIGR